MDRIGLRAFQKEGLTMVEDKISIPQTNPVYNPRYCPRCGSRLFFERTLNCLHYSPSDQPIEPFCLNCGHLNLPVRSAIGLGFIFPPLSAARGSPSSSPRLS